MSKNSTAKTAGQILFQNSLAEVVRKLRSSKSNEKDTIARCIADIKEEITSRAQMVKVTAVVKLTYFTMLGYSAEYGAFHVIEVMADSNFQNKRAGYIAASLTFNEHTDVLPLCTALLKKDLNSSNIYEVGLALYCLASVCTPDLAKDLVSDVVNLLAHQKAYVRKKAVLCLYKIFLQFPESLRPTYPKLRDKIEDGNDKSDNDPSVRGAIVSILCEMARRNPQNFLNLAVPFFSLLSTVHNNWTLIKVVKVFGYFAPLEPRLGKKLADPIANLINTTGAKSVQFECVLAVANGMSKVSSVTKLAIEKMKYFVEDRDQNLKYLGLDAMTRVMRDNPKMLNDQRETILNCLTDSDVTIRRKALELLRGLVTTKNMVATINKMFDACVRTPPDEEWSNLVIQTIIDCAQTGDYAHVHDFEWYMGVLVDLALIDLSHFNHGALIENEIITVLTRVNAVRPYGVESLSVLLSNSNLLGCDVSRSSQWMVLKAAAFACGEYPQWLPNIPLALENLLSDKVATMPVELQVLCVGAAGKIYAYVAQPCERHINLHDGEEEMTPKERPPLEDAKAVLMPPEEESVGRMEVTANVKAAAALKSLELFYHSVFPDVQEKAQLVHYLVNKEPEEHGAPFYERELIAVATGAQQAVMLPDGLDLDTPFCDDIPALMDHSDNDDDEEDEEFDEESAEAIRRREKERRDEMSAFYIKEGGGDKLDLPPVTTLETSPKLVSSSSPPAGGLRNLGRPGKKTHTISRQMAKPTTYVEATTDKSHKRSNSPEEDEATRRLRAIDVTKALTPDEKLPEATTYAALLNARSKQAAEEAKRAAAALRLAPVMALEDGTARVILQVLDSKARKDGYHLQLAVSVTNLTASSSLYDVTVKEPIKMGESQVGKLLADRKDDKEKDNKEKEDTGKDLPGGDCIVTERVKATATATKEVTIHMPTLPSSFAEPLDLALSFTFEKKLFEHTLQLPLIFKYFAMSQVELPSCADFATLVETHLKEATCVSASIPISSSKEKNLLIALPAINAQLRTHTVDVLKDCCTLYTQMVTRKSHVNSSHIAILLKDEKVDGSPALTVAVKAHNMGMIDAAIQEIAAVLEKQS